MGSHLQHLSALRLLFTSKEIRDILLPTNAVHSEFSLTHTDHMTNMSTKTWELGRTPCLGYNCVAIPGWLTACNSPENEARAEELQWQRNRFATRQYMLVAAVKTAKVTTEEQRLQTWHRFSIAASQDTRPVSELAPNSLFQIPFMSVAYRVHPSCLLTGRRRQLLQLFAPFSLHQGSHIQVEDKVFVSCFEIENNFPSFSGSHYRKEQVKATTVPLQQCKHSLTIKWLVLSYSPQSALHVPINFEKCLDGLCSFNILIALQNVMTVKKVIDVQVR